jgi:hypothetical protein
MTWVLLIGAAWLAVATLVGVLIGRGVRLADRKQKEGAAAEAADPNFVVDLAGPEPAVAVGGADVVAGTTDAEVKRDAPADPPPDPPPETAHRDAATPGPMRHPIPAARPPTAPHPARAAERTGSPREFGPD